MRGKTDEEKDIVEIDGISTSKHFINLSDIFILYNSSVLNFFINLVNINIRNNDIINNIIFFNDPFTLIIVTLNIYNFIPFQGKYST